jgi:hypothetical protein
VVGTIEELPQLHHKFLSGLRRILHKQGLMEFIKQNPLSNMITCTTSGNINVVHTIRYDPRSDAVVGIVGSSIFGQMVSVKLALEIMTPKRIEEDTITAIAGSPEDLAELYPHPTQETDGGGESKTSHQSNKSDASNTSKNPKKSTKPKCTTIQSFLLLPPFLMKMTLSLK